MDWIIFYSDGSTFSSNDGEWQYAPPENVEVIVMPNPDGGIMTCAGSDFYFMDQREGDNTPRWYGSDISGLFRYLRDTGYAKFGRHIGNRAYKSILERALKTEF